MRFNTFNFYIKNGHVIPALIHKCYLSKKNNKKFKVLGENTDKRNFLNSIDAAKALIIIAQKSNYNLINLGSSEEISIKKLAILIKKVSNNENDISWGKIDSKAVRKRQLDLSRINSLKFKEKFTIEEGLRETYNWFANEQIK